MPDYKILVYGYGNPGRRDDGLGNAFTERFESWVKDKKLNGFEFDSNYQLNIEDAEIISSKDLVVFVDASTENIDDYILTPVSASTKIAFTTHAASPGYVVDLCRKLFNKSPAVYLLHIKGYEWDLKEGLTSDANSNLEKALDYMKRQLINPEDLIKSFKKF